MGLLQQLPDLSAISGLAGSSGSTIGTLVSQLGSFSAGQPGSPLGAVTDVLSGLQAKLDIDVSGIAVRFPQALATIQNALPPQALEYVESIGAAYSTAHQFLDSGALVQAVPQGKSLQDVALAAIDEALSNFQGRMAGLAGGLIPADKLADINAALAAFQGLESDFAAHAADLLPFAARFLAGVEPDLLGGPLAQLQSSLAVVAKLDPAAVAAALGGPRAAAEAAFDALVASVGALDPEDALAYAAVGAKLDAVEAAAGALADALAPLYQGAEAALQAVPWNDLVDSYKAGLDAVAIPRAPSVDDLIDTLAQALDAMVSSLDAQVDPAGVAARLGDLADQIRDKFAQSPLGQVQKTLLDHLGKLRDAIAAVPTRQVQDAVTQMLQRVKSELDSLGLDQVGAKIESAFQDLESFATSAIDDQLTARVRDAVGQVLDQIGKLPIADLVAQLTAALKQLADLIGQLEAAVNQQLDSLQAVVAKLDEVSFAPVGDAVVGEIDDLKQRLQSINPDALSDLERMAIKGALALLQGLDLEGKLVKELKKDFGAAAGQVRSLLDEVSASLQRLTSSLDAYTPKALLEPLSGGLAAASSAVGRLNGEMLMAPLRDKVEGMLKSLDALSPGSLLDPLQQPYADVMALVGKLDPAQWVAPLKDLYAEIDKLIALVDITPLLEELDKRRKALFAGMRDQLLSSFDALAVPEPLKSFLDALRPVVSGMTDAIFGDPGAELQRMGADVKTRFKLSTLFEPLDALWDRLLALVGKIPQAALLSALNGIREALGVGLTALDPERILAAFRQGIGRLEALSPAALLGAQLRLPALRASFEVRASFGSLQDDAARVSARFEVVLAALDPAAAAGRMGVLARQHEELVDLLRRQVAALDFSGARSSYAALRTSLDNLPRFLFAPQPLTFEDVVAALTALRPSARAARLDAMADNLLQRLAPLQQAVAAAADRFFAALRSVASLVDPLALEGAVKDIYATLRAQVRVLDPDALAAAIKTDALDPLLAPLQAVDPAKLKARIDLAFQKARDALTAGVDKVFADIAKALDAQLQAIAAQVQALLAQIGDAATASLQGLQDIVQRAEKLVLVDVLDRLRRLVEKLQTSFDQELDRVRKSFDDMLAAIPGGSSSGASAASVGGQG